MMSLPDKARIALMADQCLTCITRDGTKHGKPLPARLQQAIKHWLTAAMTEVRNQTMEAKRDAIQKLLDELSSATDI